jgi:hypothetical protein
MTVGQSEVVKHHTGFTSPSMAAWPNGKALDYDCKNWNQEIAGSIPAVVKGLFFWFLPHRYGSHSFDGEANFHPMTQSPTSSHITVKLQIRTSSAGGRVGTSTTPPNAVFNDVLQNVKEEDIFQGRMAELVMAPG